MTIHFPALPATVMLSALLTMTPAQAGPDPVPITAEQAYDAVTLGIDPGTGEKIGVGKVVLVDVRTPAEFRFQGTAGRVDHMVLKGVPDPVVPDGGKAMMSGDGRGLVYSVDGDAIQTPYEHIESIKLSPLAVNIPCATWNQETGMMDPSPGIFLEGIEILATRGARILITMCNSGGRSTACLEKLVPDELAGKFSAFYEIDRPGDRYEHPQHGIHLAGLGGFQGSAYHRIFNGSTGFPGRPTGFRPEMPWGGGPPDGPSVSWRDSGLPVFVPETSCNLPDVPPTP